MHDPFNGFGPINMVDLGILPRARLLDGLLDDRLTGEHGMFPTNLTGGLKGRGHPLGATGMIQVVENHRLILEKGFAAGLSHSIGGPINNNVVILLERAAHFRHRPCSPISRGGCRHWGPLKPKQVNVDALLSGAEIIQGSYVTSTTRFDYKSGEPLNTLMLVSCRMNGGRYTFLFGIGGEHYQTIAGLVPGAQLSLERRDGLILVNQMPVRRFYQRTLDGLMQIAGSGWKKFKGKGVVPNRQESKEQEAFCTGGTA